MIFRFARATWAMAEMIVAYRRILAAVTGVELAKRYSGSAFGKTWLVVYPLLLLGIYLFVYLIVFKVRFPGFSELDYTLYVFAGLVPYIGMSEAITSGAVSIRQNIHLVKNVMLPIDLIPVRAVFISMVGEMTSIIIVLALVLWNQDLTWRIGFLPIVVGLQVLFLIGCVLVLSALVVALPDISNFVNLAMMLLMFISPIGFKPDMVPPGFGPLLYLNPVHYMTNAFRTAMLDSHPVDWTLLGIYTAICCATFALGSAFFRRFKNVLVDYE